MSKIGFVGIKADVAVAAVLGLFLGLAYIFVSLRVYVKTFLSKSWGADDYLLLLSLVKPTTSGIYVSCI